LIRRTRSAKKLLADRAYDSADLRGWLHGRGTTPVIPNKSNRKLPFRFNKQAYKWRHRIENAGKKLSRFRLPHSRYHMVDLMSLGPS
jgi:transposase